jgi:hypothetical protein
MSNDRELRRMRMDMLRTRAALEREDVSSALHTLRDDATRLRAKATTLKGIGALVGAFAGRGGLSAALSSEPNGRDTRAAGGLIATVVDQVVRRPWLAALALKGLRSAKRHPGIAVAVVVGVTVATLVARRRGDPSEDMYSAPMG